MKISHKWLQEYINLPYSTNEIAEMLTNTGLEVEKVEHFQSVPGGLEGLVIGQVEEIRKHPNADKLSLTKVNAGAEELLNIVCGAPNVAEGQRVIVAPVGTTIYPINGDPFTIQKTKIRGEASEGMICAEDEIGLGESHEGIMVLDETYEVGKPLTDYMNVYTDTIYEIGLTPNRGDAFSHIGTARDLFASLKFHKGNSKEITYPDVSTFKPESNDSPIEVIIENPKACPRFAGLFLTNVEINPSPEWMQNRLKAVGVRPINNVVDITNYVMLEYGKPLHAYDADQVEGGKVIARNAKKGERFTTLDEVERKLDESDLMICDVEKPMCIGGVFGGLNSGVTENTRNIFLESALFNPKTLRKTSTNHGLRTDAALHFEKGIDPEVVTPAIKRAALLMKEYANATISSDMIDVYPKEIKMDDIHVTYENVHRLIGVELSREDIHSILESLDFKITQQTDEGFTVCVPGFRTEVTREADVIEEILRIYGYNNIEIPRTIHSVITDHSKNENETFRKLVTNNLSARGFHEIYSNSITQSKYVEKVGDHLVSNMVKLQNHSTVELDILRPHMVFGGLESLAYNLNRQQNSIQFFEFGQTYKVENAEYIETSKLSLWVTGNVVSDSWNQKSKETDYYYLKGIAQYLLAQFDIKKTRWSVFENDLFEYGQYIETSGEVIGFCGLLQKSVTKLFEIKQPVYYAEFDWNGLLKLRKVTDLKFKHISKFPAVQRDLAVILDDEVEYELLAKIAKQMGQPLLGNIKLFDNFKHEKIGVGKKSYGLSFTFQNNNRTLTDNEIDEIMLKLMKKYESELNAEIRR